MPKSNDITPTNVCPSDDERKAYARLVEMLKNAPIPDQEILANLSLFLVRASLGRMLFMYKLYMKTLSTHGIIIEFGTRWGQNLGLLTALRGIYEPYNLTRQIIAFDTFEGFPTVTREDGTIPESKAGGLAVTPDYENYLEELLSTHQLLLPRNHIRRHELIKGDVMETLPEYLRQHPETVISLAFFDLDLYKPTKKCLELIRPYLAKNSIVGFDQVAWPDFPGETQAFRESWGIHNFELLREPESPQQCYIVMK